MSAADDRYNRSEKGRARTRRHNARRTDQRNERRVYVGRYYAGTMSTPEQADIVNDHARDHFAREGESE